MKNWLPLTCDVNTKYPFSATTDVASPGNVPPSWCAAGSVWLAKKAFGGTQIMAPSLLTAIVTGCTPELSPQTTSDEPTSPRSSQSQPVVNSRPRQKCVPLATYHQPMKSVLIAWIGPVPTVTRVVSPGVGMSAAGVRASGGSASE